MSTEESAVANLATIGLTQAQKARNDKIQRSIARTMREVVRDRSYNPNALAPRDAVKLDGVGVARGSGWRESAPLEVPGGEASQRLIEQLCDAMLGPGAPAQPKAPAQPAPAPVAAPAPPTAEPTTAAAPAAAQRLRRRLT